MLNRENRLQIAERRSKRRLAAFCVLTVGLLPLVAAAQMTEPLLLTLSAPTGPQAPAVPGQPISAGQTVTQRPRTELDPIGLRFGDFFWFPQGEIGELYSDNILATPSSTSTDLITVLQPRFDLLSSFPRHALNLHAGATRQFYARHPDQNTSDGFGAADGRLDMTAGSSFYGGAQFARLHSSRTSPDSPGNAAQPVTYNSYTANAGYAQTRLRFGYQGEMAVNALRYDGVPLIGGGILPQSGNDLNVYQIALRGSYEFVPDYQGFIRFTENLRIYPSTLPGGLSFNSQGHRADLGIQILPAGLAHGEFYAGYLSQEFRTSGLAPISGFDAGGRLVWNVTQLTTVTLNALRSVNQSNPLVRTTGTGYLASTIVGSVDHELLRNLLLTASVGYENEEFSGVSRNDELFSASVGVKYLLNRNLYLGGSYNYQQRISSGSAATTPYRQNMFLVRLSTQFVSGVFRPRL